jgi:hypothetical protein
MPNQALSAGQVLFLWLVHRLHIFAPCCTCLNGTRDGSQTTFDDALRSHLSDMQIMASSLQMKLRAADPDAVIGQPLAGVSLETLHF